MSFLFDLFFPKTCVVCQKSGVMLCENCFDKLKPTKQKCPMCGKDALGGKTHLVCKKNNGMDGLWSLWNYRQKEVQKIVKAVKYKFSQEVIEEIFKKLEIEKMEVDMIIPIPLNKYRRNWRGFNQAELIAEKIGKKWGIGVSGVLMRVKKTKPLAEMKNVTFRRKEISDAFEINTKERGGLKNMRVLLVDDVFTSGATMKEATKVLKQIGISEVWGMTLAN